MFLSSFGRLIALGLVVFTLTLGVFAQDLDDVTIAGKVTDANGLPVVGATVMAKSVETGLERSVVTDDEGRYKIVKLKPGIYKIKASQTGFGAVETAEITTISAQNLEQAFKLSPAGVTAETVVTVTDDDAPVVDGDVRVARRLQDHPAVLLALLQESLVGDAEPLAGL